MQNTASLPTDQFEELLRRLPAALDLDSLARQTKAIERRRALDSGADLLRLALARGPGGLSLSETAAWARGVWPAAFQTLKRTCRRSLSSAR